MKLEKKESILESTIMTQVLDVHLVPFNNTYLPFKPYNVMSKKAVCVFGKSGNTLGIMSKNVVYGVFRNTGLVYTSLRLHGAVPPTCDLHRFHL